MAAVLLQRPSTHAGAGGAMQRYTQRAPALSSRSPSSLSLALTCEAFALATGTKQPNGHAPAMMLQSLAAPQLWWSAMNARNSCLASQLSRWCEPLSSAAQSSLGGVEAVDDAEGALADVAAVAMEADGAATL